MTDQDMLKDHEDRIRKLEESDLKRQIELANISKSQSEIKLMINDLSKEQRQSLNNFTEQVLNALTNNVVETQKTENKIKVQTQQTKSKLSILNTKEAWAIMAVIATAVISYINRH